MLKTKMARADSKYFINLSKGEPISTPYNINNIKNTNTPKTLLDLKTNNAVLLFLYIHNIIVNINIKLIPLYEIIFCLKKPMNGEKAKIKDVNKLGPLFFKRLATAEKTNANPKIKPACEILLPNSRIVNKI